jgi:carbamoyl-phosphate synthase large subunit
LMGEESVTQLDSCRKMQPLRHYENAQDLGYNIISTKGTAAALKEGGVNSEVVLKIQEGRPNATDLMKNGEIAMMFITSTGDEPDVRDGKNLRRAALALKIPVITTVAGARATTQALAGLKKAPLRQVPIQDYFPEAAARSDVAFKIVG